MKQIRNPKERTAISEDVYGRFQEECDEEECAMQSQVKWKHRITQGMFILMAFILFVLVMNLASSKPEKPKAFSQEEQEISLIEKE